MNRKIALMAAGACLGLIVYATLSPMAGRPVFISHHEPLLVAAIERLCAYGLLGVLVARALPDRLRLACVLVVGAAFLLELLQALQPDRDPYLPHALQKALGGLAGILLVQMIVTFRRNRSRAG
ncbi:VanZ family protein [Bradyrhizobium liaoningense]|uniref:VanZ family protein n=1 Tax=Bradyrhizobium liaoningense TaxID=43992 RepID=UPI001BAA1374|nr:VanZ family protein [Bradyrhizobium liaoningense]MBR0715526.1 VanZ family protein [Bradyrhizobium liaoningense]